MSDQPPVVIVGGKRRGRPRAPEPGSTLSVWMPQSAHDHLVKQAEQSAKSVSALVRDLLLSKT